MRHFLNPLDFSVEEIDQVLSLAEQIRENPEHGSLTLFNEPLSYTLP